MKSPIAILFLFSVILGAYEVDARRDPGNYWKTFMKDEAMPKALSDLLLQDPPSKSTGGGKDWLSGSPESNMGRFTRNFNVEPNVILYHTKEDESKKTTQHAIVEN